MKGKITKIQNTYSKLDKCQAQYIFFKLSNGKSAFSYITPACRNNSNWADVIERTNKGEELTLHNLKVRSYRGKNLVNADSLFTVTTSKNKENPIDESEETLQWSFISHKCDKCGISYDFHVNNRNIEKVKERLNTEVFLCTICKKKQQLEVTNG